MMGFRYACFVSYCHGQHELMKGFIDQLKTALKAELELLMNEELYIDEERLSPGYRYNEELARAICQSVCMIVVYSPKYERQEYCVREFEGMEQLEKKRGQLLGATADEARSFIIPIILRGDDDVPERIKRYRHYANFSRFTLAMPDIIRNPAYVEEIRKIATVIYEQYNSFRVAGADPSTLCTEFQLPPASEVVAWRPQFVNR
ncbi:MAG: toll/interleukin-1 receptor domain-containing protein [Terrimicrobiaceae bacterium]